MMRGDDSSHVTDVLRSPRGSFFYLPVGLREWGNLSHFCTYMARFREANLGKKVANLEAHGIWDYAVSSARHMSKRESQRGQPHWRAMSTRCHESRPRGCKPQSKEHPRWSSLSLAPYLDSVIDGGWKRIMMSSEDPAPRAHGGTRKERI